MTKKKRNLLIAVIMAIVAALAIYVPDLLPTETPADDETGIDPEIRIEFRYGTGEGIRMKGERSIGPDGKVVWEFDIPPDPSLEEVPPPPTGFDVPPLSDEDGKLVEGPE